MEGAIAVAPERLDTLYDHGLELPYVEFGDIAPAIKLNAHGQEYWYYRTLPLKGYSAVLARYVRELQASDQAVLLARFQTRIYIYATGVRPIGAGKAPAA